MAVYVRGSGRHTAERVRPVPGSDEEARLERLVSSGEGGWRRLEDPPGDGEAIRPPARSATKAAWVAYADSQDPADHASMTKDELIAQYGGES